MIELLTVISITIVVAIVPGPDFVVVTRNALAGGRLTGIMTALGIALALAVHVTYAIAGIAVVVSQSIYIFNALKLIGAAYLLWLGWTMVRDAKQPLAETGAAKPMSPWKALRWGFFTNVTNPKATMFALSVFVQVTSVDTSIWIKIGYGFVMAGGVFAWFALVTFFFTQPAVRQAFLKAKYWLDATLGSILAVFGLALAASIVAQQPQRS